MIKKSKYIEKWSERRVAMKLVPWPLSTAFNLYPPHVGRHFSDYSTSAITSIKLPGKIYYPQDLRYKVCAKNVNLICPHII